MEMKVSLILQRKSTQWEKQLQKNLGKCRDRLIVVEKICPQMETRERKLKGEMRRLRQQIARASNEIYRRTRKRKATAKEREQLNERKKLMGGVEPTTRMLK